jgi:pimeloyl-ACP methyl ester carboxylesterase
VAEVEVEGLRIAYERAGSGPALVLLHGFVGDSRGTWRPQIEGLSDEFTVVAWDGPGAGFSSAVPETFRLADYADCLAGFIAALGLNRPHIGGISSGGALALEFYRRHPRVPASLVLASAYAGWAGSLPPDVVEQRLQLSLRVAELPVEELRAAMRPSLFSASAPAEAVSDFLASMATHQPSGFRALAHSMAETDLRAALPQIQVPTLVLAGDQDVRAPLEVAEALHAAIPRSELVVLAGAGHVCCVEAPERFNSAVRAFLRRL